MLFLKGAKKVRKIFNYLIFKLLPLGRVSGYNFRYFIPDDSFTKSDIISKLLLVDGAKDYLPDDGNIKNLTRGYLLSISYILIF